MVIQVENLSKKYKVKKKTSFWRDLFLPKFEPVLAVGGISFEIKKGESVAMLGPNGAGKTTTMKMLSGLIYPSSGKIEVLGFSPFERKKEFLMKIALVMGAKSGLDWDLTSEQSFQLIRKIYHVKDRDYNQKVKQLTEMLGVEKHLNTQVRKLSLGERMKMELIGAILHEPDILFLDEPTIGLDIISKQRVRDFLRQIQKESEVTLLLTSHDMDDVEKVCDRVMVINRGTKVYDDSLDTLTRHYSKERFVKFIFKQLPDKVSFGELGKIVEEDESSYVIKTTATKLPELISKAADKYELVDIDILSVPLEEIIGDIYQRSSL